MEQQNTKKKALELLARLSEAHGTSSFEDAVRRIFRKESDGTPYTDQTGNIFTEKRGSAQRPVIMLTAHMDEVGFVVQSITKSGLIRFVPLGSWWPHTLLAQRMRIRTQAGREVIGVIGAKPPHLLGENEREKVMKIDEMFIDIGAVDGDEVGRRFGIRPGDSIVPESTFTPMDNPDLLLCKAFDNRVGVALTLQALQILSGVSHPNTVVGVGTVQEEVGVRGAHTAAHKLNPDLAIVLEGAPADDLPGIVEEERQGVLGRGVQIRLLDPSAIMNRALVDHAVGLAQANRISYQIAVRKSGGTDAKAIHLHGSGVPTLVLGVPARYIHTSNGIIHMRDYLSVLELVLKLLESLDQSTVQSFTAFAD